MLMISWALLRYVFSLSIFSLVPLSYFSESFLNCKFLPEVSDCCSFLYLGVHQENSNWQIFLQDWLYVWRDDTGLLFHLLVFMQWDLGIKLSFLSFKSDMDIAGWGRKQDMWVGWV